MLKIASFLAVLVLISGSPAALADRWNGVDIEYGSKPETPQVISGSDAGTRTKAIKYGINWINSLPKAQEEARRVNKPIFWLHMLGNIDGYT